MRALGLALVVLVACRGSLATNRGGVSGKALPSGVTSGMIVEGDSIFHARACQRCHGPDAKGTRNGPDLTDRIWLHSDGSYPELVRLITRGVPLANIKDTTHTLDMQPRGGNRNPLTDAQIMAVAAYVFSISR